MIKNILIGLLCLFFGIFNVNASTYTGWEHESVNTLPTASESTLNKIYDYNNKYFVTVVNSTESVKLRVGDTIEANSYIYIMANNLKELMHSNLPKGSSSCPKIINVSRSNGYKTYFGLTDYFDSVDSALYTCSSSGYSSCSQCSYINDFTYKWYFQIDYTVTSINDTFLKDYLYKSISDVSYTWKEIGYYDWFELNDTESTDFYLFYTFTDISSFDVFSWVDFTSFTDYQKICVVVGINILFLLILFFSIYILLKGLNKLISWLF